MGPGEFRAAFEFRVKELSRDGSLVMSDREELCRIYLSKLPPPVRSAILDRRWVLDGAGSPPRELKSWWEAAFCREAVLGHMRRGGGVPRCTGAGRHRSSTTGEFLQRAFDEFFDGGAPPAESSSGRWQPPALTASTVSSDDEEGSVAEPSAPAPLSRGGASRRPVTGGGSRKDGGRMRSLPRSWAFRSQAPGRPSSLSLAGFQ